MNHDIGSPHKDTLEAIKRLCRVIIHDVNNPLSAVSGYLQLIELRLNKLKEGDDSVIDTLIDFHQKTCVGVERIASLIARLDNFSKMKITSVSYFNMKELITQLIERRSMEEQERIQFTCENQDEEVTLQTLAASVEQVFLELLDNALWATQSEGKIEIVLRAEEESDRILVEFRDSGPGIKPEILEKLIFPCYWTRDRIGFAKAGLLLGMGLPVVYQIMNALKGEFRMESQVGEGTCVHLEFPKKLSI